MATDYTLDQLCEGCQRQVERGHVYVGNQLPYKGDARVLIVGNAPGAEEEKSGQPFVGDSGTLLRRALRELGIPASSYAMTNAVRCRTGYGNPDPPMKWIRQCRDKCMDLTLATTNPDLIVCLGKFGLRSFTNDGNLGLTKARHKTFWYEWGGRRIPVIGTWPPSHVLRHAEAYGWWMSDLNAYFNNNSWDRTFLEAPFRELERLTPGALNQQEFTLDVETTGLEPWNNDLLRCSGVRPRGSLTSISTGGGGRGDLSTLSKRSDVTLRGHGLQFDLMWGLEEREVPDCRVVDSLYLHYLLDERYPSRGLKHLARLYTPYEPLDLPKGGVDHDLEEVLPYCADDVGLTDLVVDGIIEEMDGLGIQWHKSMELYGRVIPILAGMTRTGIPVDRAVLEEARKHEEAAVEAATKHLVAVWNANKPLRAEDCLACEGSGSHIDCEQADGEETECHVCSGKGYWWEELEWDPSILDRYHDLSDYIYGDLEYPHPVMKGAFRRDKRGSTARAVLEAVMEMNGDPTGFIQAVFDHRDVHENLNKYVLDVEKKLGLDGRIRPRFNIIAREDLPEKNKKSGAKTGRMSVSQPGLHSTPGGHPMRRAFTPLPDHTHLVQIDRAQAELTDLAQISRDENLLRLINEKGDQHERMAALAGEAGFPMARSEAKTVNFGILYGIGPGGLEQRTRFDKRAGSRFIDLWFDEYPAVRALQREVHYLALKRGYVETLSGRRRNFPLGLGSRSQEGGRAQRQAFNFIIQALANDINMLFLVGWCDRGLHHLAFPIFLIHDAVLFSTDEPWYTLLEMRKAYQEWFPPMVEQFLGQQLAVTLRADAKLGPNWGEMLEKDDEGKKLFWFSTDPTEGFISKERAIEDRRNSA